MILINEIAWSGTQASAYDEWIELHNPGSNPVDLEGWTLSDGGDIFVTLLGSLPPHGFFLLERTDDCTIADIPADQTYTGGLRNSGEILVLRDPQGQEIDSANAGGGPWPAGQVDPRISMERVGDQDQPGSWASFTGNGSTGHDCVGQPISGTPRHPNSHFATSPNPTQTNATATVTVTLLAPPPSFPALTIFINEVAWAGTLASGSDEWIELFNPGHLAIDLHGWTLTDSRDVRVALEGVLPARAFYLLERGSDTTVADITADQIYTGSLKNEGETLLLMDPTGSLIDSANLDGGAWHAGNLTSRASMERFGGHDHQSYWGTFTGYLGNGHDSAGGEIPGSPRAPNSVLIPTPTPSPIPARVVINEALIRPRFDWNGDGEADLGDEFIELHSLGPDPVNLTGWWLDDLASGGSKPYQIQEIGLMPGGYLVFFRTETGIALNDSGDTVRLLAPDGRLLNEIHYLRVRAYNLSFGRLPDGYQRLFYDLWPTPARRNERFMEPIPITRLASAPVEGFVCSQGFHLRALLPHLARCQGLVRWMVAQGLVFCGQ